MPAGITVGRVFTLRVFQPFMCVVPVFREASSSVPLIGTREDFQMWLLGLLCS